MSYVIITDTACDIRPEVLDSWGIKALPLIFRFVDEDKEYTEADMPISEFYAAMRSGRVAKTAAINVETFKGAFEKYLLEGNDVLYIGFSSGLSSTYNSGRMAAESLKASYPDRKILTVDSKCASAGQGLLVYLAYEKMQQGADIDALYEYTATMAPKVSHWFTVDDLVYLKRGGRVSSAAAFFGNLIGIKPVLHVDDEGKLIPMVKVRGRKTAITTLADKYGESAEDPASGTVFISQADCMADAEALAAMLNSRYGVSTKIITDIGAVIGSHSGPGTLALFFIAKER